MFVNVQSSTSIIPAIIVFMQVSFSQIITFSHIQLKNQQFALYGRIMVR